MRAAKTVETAKVEVGILESEYIRLVPLEREHTKQLYQAIDSREIWTYLPSRMESYEDMEAHVAGALEQRERGTEVPFVVVDKETNAAVGMTRFEEVSVQNRSVEIGWTWYSQRVWRTRVNTEAKFLLLRHCFEVLNLVRVQFTVDTRNVRSREAVLRIGARQEGTLRKCGILADGYIRDMVYYSIVDDEWPDIRERMIGLLSRRSG